MYIDYFKIENMLKIIYLYARQRIWKDLCQNSNWDHGVSTMELQTSFTFYKDIKCSFYVFYKGKSEIRVLEEGWTEDQVICIYMLGSLIHGKITGQKTTVFVVTGVVKLSLCPVLLLALPALSEFRSVRTPSVSPPTVEVGRCFLSMLS